MLKSNDISIEMNTEGVQVMRVLVMQLYYSCETWNLEAQDEKMLTCSVRNEDEYFAFDSTD